MKRQNDPVLAAKEEFIKDMASPCGASTITGTRENRYGILLRMTHALGWEGAQNRIVEHLFVLPETTLYNLAESIKTRLSIRALRVAGDPR